MKDIERDYNYHAPNGTQPMRYEAIRGQVKYLAAIIESSCPDSREKSLAFTKLDECMMWANASIARNE
jgi:hypothetical protein